MILDWICYSIIMHFGRIILYVLWRNSPVVSLFWSFPDAFLVISTSSFVAGCLQTPVSPLECYATYILVIYIIFSRLSALPSGEEGALTLPSFTPKNNGRYFLEILSNSNPSEV